MTETSFVLSRSLISQNKAKVIGYKASRDAPFAIVNYEYDNYARMNGTTGTTHISKYNSTYFPQNNADKPTVNFHSWVDTESNAPNCSRTRRHFVRDKIGRFK